MHYFIGLSRARNSIYYYKYFGFYPFPKVEDGNYRVFGTLLSFDNVVISYQLMLKKMREELVNLNYCAVPF